jgi:hypothetical protein
VSCCCEDALLVRQGDDVSFDVAVLDGAGDPYDLSTVLGIFCVLHGCAGPTDVTITKTLGAGIVVVAPASGGVFTVTLTRVDTASMKAGTVYELEIRLQVASGDVVTIYEGDAAIEPQLSDLGV